MAGGCDDTTVVVVVVVGSFCCFCISFTLGITLLGSEPPTVVESTGAVVDITTVELLVTGR